MKSGNESQGPSILVVDDDQALASSLKDFLTREGYAVEVALSGAEALAIQASNPNVALALVDLVMPVMGGLEALRQIRARDPQAQVVVVTALDQKQALMDSIREGALDFIVKPFERERVLKLLAKLGG